MSVCGFIVDTDYTEIDGQTYVQIFGRLEHGESFVVMNRFEPYFFIRKADELKAKKVLKDFRVENTAFFNFRNELVLKISSASQEKINKLSKELHEMEISTYESDIKPQIRFVMDRDLKGSVEISGDYESGERVDRIYRDVEVKGHLSSVKLKVLSVDIETSGDKKDLFCIGLYSKDYKKSLMITDKKIQGIISCKDELDCLEKFKKEILEFDPDIITGWNLIDFDLKDLNERFKKNKVSFDIGRTNDNLRLRIEDNFFRKSSASVVGRQVIDGLNLIRDPFIQGAPSIKSAKFESYTLENVSGEILGKGKTIKEMIGIWK